MICTTPEEVRPVPSGFFERKMVQNEIAWKKVDRAGFLPVKTSGFLKKCPRQGKFTKPFFYRNTRGSDRVIKTQASEQIAKLTTFNRMLGQLNSIPLLAMLNNTTQPGVGID